MNKKGFTLIELLTVIVILIIVSLVITPTLLKIINDSKESGAEEKAWKTIEAVKATYYEAKTLGFMDSEKSSSINFENNKLVVTFNGITPKFGDVKEVKISGESPISGIVSIDTATKKITCQNLKFNDNGLYTCTTNDSGSDMKCCKGEEKCSYKS